MEIAESAFTEHNNSFLSSCTYAKFLFGELKIFFAANDASLLRNRNVKV